MRRPTPEMSALVVPDRRSLNSEEVQKVKGERAGRVADMRPTAVVSHNTVLPSIVLGIV
jgi:hypothetical protein